MSQQHPQFQPAGPVQNGPAPKQKHRGRTLLIVLGSVVGLIVVLGVIGAAAGSGEKGGKAVEAGATLPKVVTKTSAPPEAAPSKTAAPTATAPAATQAPEVTQPAMTKSQEQAIGSAESYLESTAFSRKGLIRQLSSKAGEGFSVADARYAVDHIKVDWNEQAAKSAKTYLAMSSFSRQGLIRQLKSSAGEGFTHSQAVYGVSKAGL